MRVQGMLRRRRYHKICGKGLKSRLLHGLKPFNRIIFMTELPAEGG
jgi:hypothetical protein